MIRMINCTLDDFEWVTDGAHPPLTRCQNQSESYATLKASLLHQEDKIINKFKGMFVPLQEAGDFAILGECETPCQWIDFTPRLTNYDDSQHEESYIDFHLNSISILEFF